LASRQGGTYLPGLDEERESRNTHHWNPHACQYYRFGPDDGPETFPGQRVSLVDGRYLTWYGPSLTTARSVLTSQLGAS
jgi:hypothetical protein